MSYNIDTAKVKELKDFTIKVEDLYKAERKDWHPSQPEILDIAKMRVKISGGGGGFELEGILDPVAQTIAVEKFNNYGEGSGSFEHYVLDTVYKGSTGTLVVTRVWEGGDSIDKLTVVDGVVTTENIEL